MNNYYRVISSSDHLEHYGVLGMKWGVRRYERSSGQKTRSRLKKYYDAESKYEKANNDLKAAKNAKKSADASNDYNAKQKAKTNLREAKAARNKSKQDMKIAYKKVKRGASYDRGREAYANGKTIVTNNMKLKWAGIAGGVAAALGAQYADQSNATFTTNSGKTIKVSDIIYASDAIAYSALLAKTLRDNADLRTYYAGG